MIHGMFAGAWMWENYQARFASRGFETHAMQLRGHGDDAGSFDIGGVSLDDYVVDATGAAARLDRPVVVGHSMGGLIAQKVAEAGLARLLVLVSAAPPRGIPVVSWQLLRRQLRYVPSLLFSRPMVPNRADADALMFNRTPPRDRDEQFSRLVPDSGRAGRELSLGIPKVDEDRVRVPVLVVTGLDDQFVVPRVARALARKYSAELAEYPGHAHHIITEPGWEQPCDDIISWIEKRSDA